jgi:hypothetical protein
MGPPLIDGKLSAVRGFIRNNFLILRPPHRRHPEVLALLGEPRRMSHKRQWRSFETPRKSAAPQDDG